MHKLYALSAIMRKLLLLCALIFLAEASFGQSFYAVQKQRSVILVAGTGTSTYFGELANPGDYIDAKPNINAGLQYYFTPRISARAELTWFTLEGDDAKADDASRVSRNLSFKSNNVELGFTGAFNLFPNGNRYYRRPYFNAYGFGGVGLLYFNPTTEYQGTKYALQPLKTEGEDYSRIGVVVPFGLGVRFKAGPNFNVALEGGYRKIFTDYLDDVSTIHLGPAAFSDPIAAALSDRRPEVGKTAAPAGTQRGNPDEDDGYMLLNVKIEYYLPWDLGGQNSGRTYSKKRSASYRYNKKGGVKR
jgi:hypothetical protein